MRRLCCFWHMQSPCHRHGNNLNATTAKSSPHSPLTLTAGLPVASLTGLPVTSQQADHVGPINHCPHPSSDILQIYPHPFSADSRHAMAVAPSLSNPVPLPAFVGQCLEKSEK